MCREPSLTMVSFLLLVLDYGYSKIIVFSALGAIKIKILVWRTPRHETPMTSNHELKDFTLVTALSENLKCLRHFVTQDV